MEKDQVAKISCDKFRELLAIPPGISEAINKVKDEHISSCFYCQEYVAVKKYAFIRGN
jgi:hypothetical protein